MNNLFKSNSFLFLITIFIISFTACDKKDPEPVEEQELITTVKLTLVNKADVAEVVTATWRDPDGDGGDQPTVNTLVLKPNTVYNASVEFLDESNPTNPLEMTAEIIEEDIDHQIFYEESGGANVIINQLNNDSKGLPLGTDAVFNVGEASTGFLKVILKHKPGQKAAGDTKAKGETDIEVDFPIIIQ